MSTGVATVDLPYLEKNKSRHDRMRYYFRVNKKRICRLPDNPDSQEFAEAYWRERKRLENGEKAPLATKDDLKGAPVPGTFRALCVAYLRSDAYTDLDATTRTKRRQIIDAMLLEPVTPGDSRIFASMPIAALDVTNLEVLRDRKKDTPFAADERLKILRQIFDTTKPGKDGKPVPIVRENRARLVKPFRRKTEGHHTILIDEIEQYIKHHGVGSKAVLALVILMYTGLRVSDLAAIGPQHRRGDTLVLRVFKNRERSPVTLTIAIHPVLDEVLRMHRVKGMNYLLTDYGKPFSIKGLSQRVSEWFSQAGLRHCTAHTVRKGLATNLAESEATDSMLDGLFGWKDGKTSKIYTAKKQQAKLARQAVLRIDWGQIGNLVPHLDEGMEFPTPRNRKTSS